MKKLDQKLAVRAFSQHFYDTYTLCMALQKSIPLREAFLLCVILNEQQRLAYISEWDDDRDAPNPHQKQVGNWFRHTEPLVQWKWADKYLNRLVRRGVIKVKKSPRCWKKIKVDFVKILKLALGEA